MCGNRAHAGSHASLVFRSPGIVASMANWGVTLKRLRRDEIGRIGPRVLANYDVYPEWQFEKVSFVAQKH